MATILIADDEAEIVELLRDYLEAEGYTAIGVGDGDAALETALEPEVDCIILDIMMPGKTGFEVCKRVRERRDVPIIFLSARQSDVDKIRGLGLGGDDYVGKPFSPGEVVARVRAVLRRYQKHEAAPAPRLAFGRLEIDMRAREVFVDGRTVSLTPKENCCSSWRSIPGRSSPGNSFSTVSGATLATCTRSPSMSPDCGRKSKPTRPNRS